MILSSSDNTGHPNLESMSSKISKDKAKAFDGETKLERV